MAEKMWESWYYQNIVLPELYPDAGLYNDQTIYVCYTDGVYWVKDETGAILFLNA